MSVVRVVNRDAVRPVHVVMVCLLGATLAGNCLLTCGPNALLEGATDWAEESGLRAIVHVLNLNYTQTTALGVEIKSLVFGIGAALGAIVFGLMLAVRPPSQEETAAEDTVLEESTEQPVAGGIIRRPIPPLAAAQVLAALYVLWSFASCKWSTAPDLALGGSTLLAFGVVWALVVGRCLNRRTATVGGCVLVVVCAATAALAIAYYDERNPTRRASYPLGNPLFLAACLVPGVLLCVGLVGAAVQSLARRLRTGQLLVIAVCLAAAVLTIWAIHLTGSRSGVIAGACGLVALSFFMLRGPAKIAVAVGSVLLGVLGIWLYVWPQFSTSSATGRDASLRVRAYAWSYAVELIDEAKILGHGQGGFAQYGDGYASLNGDVLHDPLALDHRIAHAHNEWLEVWADLGLVGFMLVVGTLCSTLWAGMVAMRAPSPPYRRWVLAALMASLVALIVEQSADVALRIAGLPALFYSVVGLIWALSRPPRPAGGSRFGQSLMARRTGGLGAVAIGLSLLLAALLDFDSARAEYGADLALGERSFDKAVALAEQSSHRRLSPSRRLEAMERLCRIHIYIAREFQTSSLDRAQRARATDPPDGRLLNLAEQDRALSERHIAAARRAWKELWRRSPNYFGLGWLEFRLYQLGGVFAELDGDEQQAEDKLEKAVEALVRELRRQPYDPLVAISYVELVGGSRPLADRLALLARPLRLTAIPPEYSGYLWELANTPTIDREFGPMNWDGCASVFEQGDANDLFFPEKLRLAANVHFLRDAYARAADAARGALLWYDWVAPGPWTGRSACRYELAEYTFFLDPSQWRESVAQAERAIEALPSSTPGRRMERMIRDRLIDFHLAGEDEETATELVRQLNEMFSEARVRAELGRRYAFLAKSLIRRRRSALPEGFNRWVDRAVQLAPQEELAWRLKAQLAYDDGEVGRAVEHLQRALSLGAEPPVVYAFVNLALAEHPENADLQGLASDLQAVLHPGGFAPDSPPASPGAGADTASGGS